jgi:hypothetical protein
LRGFAIKRGVSGQPQTFLRGIKFFEELVPAPAATDSFVPTRSVASPASRPRLRSDAEIAFGREVSF